MGYKNPEDKKEYMKKYYEKKKEKIKQYKKEWIKNNPEKKSRKEKEYYEKHKEKIKQLNVERNKINSVKIKQQKRDYQRTPKGRKQNIISGWKYIGLKLFGYTYDEVYEYYLDCDNCEVCNEDISMGGHKKNMDHCHDTGIFRWVLCHRCNANDSWMNKI